MVNEIVVLRYGHRSIRDYRVTSHCGLVARALGATKIVICGEEDPSLTKSIDDVVYRWGGDFKVAFADSWRKQVKEYKEKGYLIVHLTAYGLPISEKIGELRKSEKVLVVIGSQKVEREVYEVADHNISITNQPHSEIGALAITLDHLFEGKELEKDFGGNIRVVPSEKDKHVIKS